MGTDQWTDEPTNRRTDRKLMDQRTDEWTKLGVELRSTGLKIKNAL